MLGMCEIPGATQDEIEAEAKSRGYVIREVPSHYATAGIRLSSSPLAETYPDPWMNAANVRLYEIQMPKKSAV